MKFLLTAIICLFVGHAYAADAPKAPPIDFKQTVPDPLGNPIPSCGDDKKPECGSTVLRAMVYMALSAPPRDQHGQAEPGNPSDAELGWKVMAATEPLYISDSDKTRIVAALRRGFTPGSAYAACRLIINPDDCGKP